MRADQNQAILDALHLAGMSAFEIKIGRGVTAILAGYLHNNYLLMVKQKHKDLTVPEMDFFLNWRGHKSVISTPRQAVEVVEDDWDR